MVKTISIFSILLICCNLAFTQELNDGYDPLQAEGVIPKDFLEMSSEKFFRDKESISKNQSRKSRKTEEQFLLETNFGIDRLLLSGLVLFNDPLTDYVNAVADEVLKDDTELRSELRIYVVKSTAVNAFATNNGIILITVGLLAQLENEAQLAFILSHEITHYVEKHALNKYVVSKSISKGRGVYKDFSFYDRLLAENNYSKDLETEADEQGFDDFYVKSNYSLKAIDGAFDVLQFAYLPFNDLKFDKSFFEKEHYKFPESYILAEEDMTPINVEPDEDDEESTHPSIPKRREAIAAKIEVAGKDGGKDYIVSEQKFHQVKNFARFELSRLYLINLYYDAAIYNSYLLLKEYPNNLYLKKIIAKSLIGLSKYANENDFYDVHIDYDDVEGEQQQLYYLLELLGDAQDEINILAVTYTWNLRKLHPEDEEVKLLSETALHDLVFESDYKLEDFKKEPPVIVEDTVVEAPVDTTDEESMSKYEKLRKKKEEEKTETEKAYFKYAFVDLFEDNEFVELFKDEAKANKKADREEKKKYSRSRQKVLAKKERQESKQIYKKGYALDIDKIVVLDPSYARLNLRKEDSYNYLKSEAGQIKIKEAINRNARAAGLRVEILDSRDLSSGGITEYNDISLMNEWIDEQLSHNDDINFSSIDLTRMKTMQEKYGTKYFMWMGALSVKDKNYMRAWFVAMSVLYPVTIPFMLPPMINASNYTYYYYMLYDVEENKMVIGDFMQIQQRDFNFIIDAHMYHTFKQIKHKN